VETLGTHREATSPHAQAVTETQRAAAMENDSTGRETMDRYSLCKDEDQAGGIQA
jgi:hypothetical protein